MSTTVTEPTTARTAVRTGADSRPSMTRLVTVELRKMVNTRSGFWVPIGVAAVTFLVALISTLHNSGYDATFAHIFYNSSLPAAFLLPVIGVLLIAAEWSQRTTLTTFTLVPGRARVILAKAGACLVVALGALIVTLIFTVLLVTLFGHHAGGAGSLSMAVIAQSWLFFAVSMWTGLAFGAAFLASAPAIVAYLLLPTIWNAIVGGFSSLASLANWLDTGNTLQPMTQQTLSGHEWLQAFTSIAFWLGIPMLIGLLRIGRGDVD